MSPLAPPFVPMQTQASADPLGGYGQRLVVAKCLQRLEKLQRDAKNTRIKIARSKIRVHRSRAAHEIQRYIGGARQLKRFLYIRKDNANKKVAKTIETHYKIQSEIRAAMHAYRTALMEEDSARANLWPGYSQFLLQIPVQQIPVQQIPVPQIPLQSDCFAEFPEQYSTWKLPSQPTAIGDDAYPVSGQMTSELPMVSPLPKLSDDTATQTDAEFAMSSDTQSSPAVSGPLLTRRRSCSDSLFPTNILSTLDENIQVPWSQWKPRWWCVVDEDGQGHEEMILLNKGWYDDQDDVPGLTDVA